YCFYKSIKYKPVHAAMACATGIVCIFLPQRMIIFPDPLIHWIPLMWLGVAFDMHAFGYIHPDPLGTLNPEPDGIGAGQVCVVSQQNSFTVGTIHHRLGHIPVFIVDSGIGMTRR